MNKLLAILAPFVFGVAIASSTGSGGTMLLGMAIGAFGPIIVLVACHKPTPPELWYPEHLGQMLMLTPGQFEEAVANILTRCGYEQMRRVGRAGDLGADLVGFSPDGETVAVQCKRYAPGHRVGTPALQSFIGMMVAHHHASQGVFVTTSEFTGPALALAAQHGIRLIDGPELTQLIEYVKTHEEERAEAA